MRICPKAFCDEARSPDLFRVGAVHGRVVHMKIGLFLAGFKGLLTLRELKNVDIEFVYYYGDKDVEKQINSICKQKQIDCYRTKSVTKCHTLEVDKIFVIGWQFILEPNDKLIVFHDSKLPELKGFGPTVAALIEGKEYLGATAFRPTLEVDTGMVYCQKTTGITYPIKVLRAFQIVVDMYVDIMQEIISGKASTLFPMTGHPTYSIWRDEYDYEIDWSWDCLKIVRFIDAVGTPFAGAKAWYEKPIRIIDAESTFDRDFVSEKPFGKIWRIKNNMPEVLCGHGMIRILWAIDENGDEVKFTKLKRRLNAPRHYHSVG